MRPFEVLLIEDNLADATIFAKLLKAQETPLELNVVRDGDEAMNYLYKKEPFLDARTPELIIMDLNLPRRGGEEIISEIKAKSELKEIPIIVLSSSKCEREIRNVYRLQANCFIHKPQNLSQLRTVMKDLIDFWFTTVHLPGIEPC